MKKYDYAFSYDFKINTNNGNGFIEDEIENGPGYADALLICSILREGIKAHDGATSHSFVSFDGQNDVNEIPSSELFSVWGSLANFLLESNSFFDERDIILKDTLKKIKEFILKRQAVKMETDKNIEDQKMIESDKDVPMIDLEDDDVVHAKLTSGIFWYIEKNVPNIYKLHRFCSECGKGEMIFNGNGDSADGEPWEHECNQCNSMDYFMVKYPYLSEDISKILSIKNNE